MFKTAVRGAYPKYPSPPRPALLANAIRKWRQRRIEDYELEQALQRSQVDILAEQVAAGVEVGWDGQAKMDHPADYIYRRLKGFQAPPDRLVGVQLPPRPLDIEEEMEEYGGNGNGEAKHILGTVDRVPAKAVEKVAWSRPIISEDFRFLASRSPIELRPALLGPFTLAHWCDAGIYTDRNGDLMQDFGRALNRELEGLQAVGAKLVLIEEPLFDEGVSDAGLLFDSIQTMIHGIDLQVFLAFDGRVVDYVDALARLPITGLALNLATEPENLSLFREPKLCDLILEAGVISGRASRADSEDAAVALLQKAAEGTDPSRIWAGVSCGMGGISRELAFAKLTMLYRSSERARRELARGEYPHKG